MHILRSAFEMERDAALDFAASRGFGLVLANDGDRPVGSHLPFVLWRAGGAVGVQCHVTRANPLAGLADGQRSFLVVATGVDAYVSNDWYVSRDQVSTWLYEAVHLTGVARRLPEDENRRHGDDLLLASERLLAPKVPWHLDAMDPAKRAAMLKAITTIEITVGTVEGQSKLNQHKSDADHAAVARALDRSGSLVGREMALRLKELRPLLDYDRPSDSPNAEGSRP